MSDDFFEEDEPVEDVTTAFGRGKKFMTIRTYIQKSNEPIQALQWLETNKDEVLEWLTILGVQYTHHEILSQNKLYVYTNGPVQVEFTDWIVRPGPTNEVVIFNQKSFAETFEASSSNNR